MKRQNSCKPISRKISRSQIAGINLIKIRLTLYSDRDPLETLPNMGKISNNNNNKNNNNSSSGNNNNSIIITIIKVTIMKIIMIQKVKKTKKFQ